MVTNDELVYTFKEQTAYELKVFNMFDQLEVWLRLKIKNPTSYDHQIIDI